MRLDLTDTPSDFRRERRKLFPRLALAMTAVAVAAPAALTQTPRPLLPIPFENSAEFTGLGKPVHASRVLDDMSDSTTWRLTGTGTLSFPVEPRLRDMKVLRVDVRMFTDTTAPTRNR